MQEVNVKGRKAAGDRRWRDGHFVSVFYIEIKEGYLFSHPFVLASI